MEAVRPGWKGLSCPSSGSRPQLPRREQSYLRPPAGGDSSLTAAHALTVAEVGKGPRSPPGLQVAGHAHRRPHLQGSIPLGLGEVLAGRGWLLALQADTQRPVPSPSLSAWKGVATPTLLQLERQPIW